MSTKVACTDNLTGSPYNISLVEGENLVAEKHAEAERIKAEVEETAEIEENVNQSWDRTKQLLLQANRLNKETHAKRGIIKSTQFI